MRTVNKRVKPSFMPDSSCCGKTCACYTLAVAPSQVRFPPINTSRRNEKSSPEKAFKFSRPFIVSRELSTLGAARAKLFSAADVHISSFCSTRNESAYISAKTRVILLKDNGESTLEKVRKCFVGTLMEETYHGRGGGGFSASTRPLLCLGENIWAEITPLTVARLGVATGKRG